VTLDPSLLSLMPDSVTIEPYLSETSGRDAAYGAAVTYQAQILPWTERVIGRDGRDRRSTAQVIIPERLVIDDRSRLTIVSPAGYTPSQPPIIAVRPGGGALGLDHTVILC